MNQTSFKFLFMSLEGRVDRAAFQRGLVYLTALAIVIFIGFMVLTPLARRDLKVEPLFTPLAFFANVGLLLLCFSCIFLMVAYYFLAAKRLRDTRFSPSFAGLFPFSLLIWGAFHWLLLHVSFLPPQGIWVVDVLAVVSLSGMVGALCLLPSRPTLPDVVEITRKLLSFPSVTPEDAGVLTYIGDLLTKAGFEVFHLPFSEPSYPTIHNLYARIGTRSPALLFAGHTDVVPPGDLKSWRFDPFSAPIEDGFMWGRGAVDMKGGIGASLAAVLRYVQENPSPQGSIGFLITGDEEGLARHGTVKILEWLKERGEHFDHCILGEPTNPHHMGEMIKIGRRGSLNLTLKVKGRQGHVAYPNLALNPIHDLIRILHTLLSHSLDQGNMHFDPSHLEITSIDVGNETSNLIPAEATASLNIRFNDIWTAETLEVHLRQLLLKHIRESEIILTVKAPASDSFLSSPDHFTNLVADIVEFETGRRPAFSTTGGTSDARFIRHFCKVLEFGLVGETMHGVDERVKIEDLILLTTIYSRIIEIYMNQEVSMLSSKSTS